VREVGSGCGKTRRSGTVTMFCGAALTRGTSTVPPSSIVGATANSGGTFERGSMRPLSEQVTRSISTSPAMRPRVASTKKPLDRATPRPMAKPATAQSIDERESGSSCRSRLLTMPALHRASARGRRPREKGVHVDRPGKRSQQLVGLRLRGDSNVEVEAAFERCRRIQGAQHRPVFEVARPRVDRKNGRGRGGLDADVGVDGAAGGVNVARAQAQGAGLGARGHLALGQGLAGAEQRIDGEVELDVSAAGDVEQRCRRARDGLLRGSIVTRGLVGEAQLARPGDVFQVQFRRAKRDAVRLAAGRGASDPDVAGDPAAADAQIEVVGVDRGGGAPPAPSPVPGA